MPTPRAITIAAAVETALAGIVGDGGTTYYYTPSRVTRYFAFSDTCLAQGLQTVYVISPDRRERMIQTAREVDQELYLDLSLATRLKLATEQPFTTDGYARAIAQEQMAVDVEKRLCGDDLTLGISGVWKTEITLWEMGPEETYHPTWAIAFGRLRVTYRHLRSQP